MRDSISSKAPPQAARSLLTRTFEQLTEQRGRKLTAKEFFPVPVDTIARDILGWRVDRVASVGSYGQGFDPIHGACDYADRVITIGVDNIPAVRQNFTLAHEIGHIVLHSDHDLGRARRVASLRSVKGAPRDTVAWKLEREADLFATELLMPAKAVRIQFRDAFACESMDALTAIRRTGSGNRNGREGDDTQVEASRAVAAFRSEISSKSLQEFFGVSNNAMALRLRELGLITA